MKLNIRLLKAAAVAASKEETRYYLKGVCLQADEKSGVILIATDGHLLLAFRQSETWEGEPINVIIPGDVIASIKLHKYHDKGELTQDGDRWSLEYAGAPGITFRMIDGTFPDWRRIVPNEYDGRQATFNPKYYGDFAKVAKVLDKSENCVSINHNGGDPALVSFGSDVDGFGVIMPLRNRENVTKPEWAK